MRDSMGHRAITEGTNGDSGLKSMSSPPKLSEAFRAKSSQSCSRKHAFLFSRGCIALAGWLGCKPFLTGTVILYCIACVSLSCRARQLRQASVHYHRDTMFSTVGTPCLQVKVAASDPDNDLSRHKATVHTVHSTCTL